MSKCALICGISGQDGAYLAGQLLDRGYRVFGTSRDCERMSVSGLERLGIRDRVALVSMQSNDFRSVISVLAKTEPDEIYNLAGQSSVALSFEQPVETFESVTVATVNLLEALRFFGGRTRLYNAASGEVFGNTPEGGADESTPFRPRSPYATAKAASIWAVANYREAYHLHVCSGLMFNHESPLRPVRFVTRKVVNVACRIAAGDDTKLHLGNVDVRRDWGWAPDYVDAMIRVLQHDRPDDYVIATGKATSLREFVAEVFAAYGLDWHDHVVTDDRLLRPTETMFSQGNADKARRELGWQPTVRMPELARRLAEAEAAEQRTVSA